jgi:hypothetical protein
LVAALVILGGVVLAALGRVGEMATFASDTPPMDLDEVSATDVALLRPPMSLWGYNAQATEDALRVIARSVTARDVEIATLRRELADLRGNSGDARATRTGPVNRPGQPPAPPPADLLAAYRPPAPSAESQAPAPAPAAEQPAPAAATRPGGQRLETQPTGQRLETQPTGQRLETQPTAPTAETQPAAQTAETQPAGQTPHQEPPDKADPPAKADPAAGDDWLPIWQRSSEPGPDE